MKARRRTLLIVEDEPTTRLMLVSRLERLHYNVIATECGADVSELVRHHRVDLVMLDVGLPDTDGFEVLRRLRAKYSAHRLPIIMITIRDRGADIVAAFELGANDYIPKPLDFAVVTARLRTHLSLKTAHQALRKSRCRYALTARGSNDGLWDWNLKSGRIYFSPRWKEMFGYQEREISHDPDEWWRRVHPEDLQPLKTAVAEHVEGITPYFNHEHRVLHKDGSFRWVLTRGLAVRRRGKTVRMAGSCSDITSRRVYDPLTGLPNHILLADEIERCIARTHRRRTNFALLFIDVDRFSLLNNSMGHKVGDQLLIAMARRLQSALRPGDVVARFGADEFAILLDDVKIVTDASKIADKIHHFLSFPYQVLGQEIFTTTSIGVATSTTKYQRVDEVLRDAQTAMYRAKALGRDRCEMFDVVMHSRIVSRVQLEADLRNALERHELRVYYQPIVSLESGRIVCFEALVRWQHPQRGLVSPVDFVPVAEETGLILPIGLYVLQEACRQTRRWQIEFPSEPPLHVSVNLSGKQFSQPDLIERIQAILQEVDFDPRHLKLEITESSIMENLDAAAEIMRRLKSLQIQLAIDDFGTGYSSLSYLHRFPIDMLKIDRSFVSRLGVEGENAEIVRTIATLGRNLGMEVTAEGIETSTQWDYLVALECKYGQGYACSRPVNAEAAAELLAQGACAAPAIAAAALQPP